MSYESDDKMVSHPDHYNSGKFEVIDIIDEFTKDLSGTEAVCTGNAIKYILRWKKKGGYQDVEKAMWYLQHMLDKHEEDGHKPHSVAIHKMSNGHYAIENLKDEKKNCTNCGHGEGSDMCPGCMATPETVKPTHWIPKKEIPKPDELLKAISVVEASKNPEICEQIEKAIGDYNNTKRFCANCKHRTVKNYLEPCHSCKDHDCWEPEEEETKHE